MKPLINFRSTVSGLLLVAFFYSCSHTNKPVATAPLFKADTLPGKVSSIITEIKISNDSLGGTIDPHAFVDCNLYSAADTSSPILSRVPAMTALISLGRYEHEGQDTISGTENDQMPGISNWRFVFYKVRLPNKSEGYILEDDVARFVITDKDKNSQYYLGHYIDRKQDVFRFRISKFELGSKKLLSHLILTNVESADFSIYYQKGSYLKNVDRSIKIVGHNDYCGGDITNVAVVDNGNTLTALPMNYTALDDGGGVNQKNTYLPDVDGSGRRILKEIKELYGDAKPSILLYPQDIKLPHDQLIIQTLLNGQFYMDENNEQVELKNGNLKMEVPITRTTRYYNWDGHKITLLPQKKKELLGSKYQ